MKDSAYSEDEAMVQELLDAMVDDEWVKTREEGAAIVLQVLNDDLAPPEVTAIELLRAVAKRLGVELDGFPTVH